MLLASAMALKLTRATSITRFGNFGVTLNALRLLCVLALISSWHYGRGFFGAEAAPSAAQSWVAWVGPASRDLFWTASTCETVTIADPATTAAKLSVAPSNISSHGMSSLLLFPKTHELLWLQGRQLMRSWMDRTGTAELSTLGFRGRALELYGGVLASSDSADVGPVLFVGVVRDLGRLQSICSQASLLLLISNAHLDDTDLSKHVFSTRPNLASC